MREPHRIRLDAASETACHQALCLRGRLENQLPTQRRAFWNHNLIPSLFIRSLHGVRLLWCFLSVTTAQEDSKPKEESHHLETKLKLGGHGVAARW